MVKRKGQKMKKTIFSIFILLGLSTAVQAKVIGLVFQSEKYTLDYVIATRHIPSAGVFWYNLDSVNGHKTKLKIRDRRHGKNPESLELDCSSNLGLFVEKSHLVVFDDICDITRKGRKSENQAVRIYIK